MIPVFFRTEMNAPAQGASPSAQKPMYAVESWLKKFPGQVDVMGFTPATLAHLRRVHDPAYVQNVLTGTEPNGFGTRDVAVAKSLLYTTGSMMAAAREAVSSGKVACSPTSGFHHASFARGEGFCTFNGLMATAAALIQEGRTGVGSVERVGILDLDMHYGNGTDDIIRRLSYRQEVNNATRRPSMGPWPRFEVFIEDIIQQLETWHRFGMADVVLYQAGADMHIDDPYGGHYSSAELRSRDRTVFETCKRLKLPVAWNLAGGYQTNKAVDPGRDFGAHIRPVLDIHDATMDECIKVFGKES